MTEATMGPLATDPDARPVARLQRTGQIEVDTFCQECGYNLHGQGVVRDERLDLLVCRCPECGRFHAAGKSTSADSLWLSRVATLALALWVLVVLFAIFWLCIGLGAVDVVHIEEFSTRRNLAPDGREVQWTNVPGTGNMLVYKGTTQPVSGGVRTVRSADWPAEPISPYWREQLIIGGTVLGLSDLGLGLVSGTLLVTFFWHWKRSRYRLVLLLPFAVAAVVLSVMLLEDDYEFIRGWAISRALMHASLQALFMYVGILIGRPVVRGLLRMFIPPRPRQLFAFLWRADGKTPPAPVAAA